MKVQMAFVIMGLFLFSPSSYAQSSTDPGPRLVCSFGDQGVRLIDAPFPCYQVTDIEVYNSGPHRGKMVVSFDICDTASTWDYDFGVARFDADGYLDQTFGDAGFVGPIDVKTNDRAVKILIQSDNKIVIVGNTDQKGCAGGSSAGLMVVRLNDDGSFDNTFSGDGKMHDFFVLNPGGCNTNLCYFYDALLSPNGRIVACGTIGGRSGNHSDITAGVAVITSSGARHRAVRVNYSNTGGGRSGKSEAFKAIAMQGTKYILAGVLNGEEVITARLGAGFGVDNTFGNSGKEKFKPSGNRTYDVLDVQVQSDKKFLVAYDPNKSSNDYYIIRRDEDGGKDDTYATDGIAQISGNSSQEQMVETEMHAGKLYIYGKTHNKDYQVRRLKSDGSLDTNLGLNGDISLETPPEVGHVTCGALRSNGQLILAGGQNVIALVRINTDKNQPPCNPIFPISASCKDLTVSITDNATVSLVASDVNNGSFAVVGIQGYSLNHSSVTCADVGQMGVVLTAIDDNSNTDTCQANLTVVDASTPIITCPGNITVDNEVGKCGKVVQYTVQTTDACSAVTLTQTDATGLTSGDEFPKGNTNLSYQAKDADGNIASCSFRIRVNDTEDPIITCPADVFIPTPSNSCDGIITYLDATATDNCPGVTVSRTSGPISGDLFPNPDTATVTFRAKDAANNTAFCSFSVGVYDGTPPTITCPAGTTVTSGPASCDAVVTYASPTASDNCGTPTVMRTSGLASGSVFPGGTTSVVTYEATDTYGNTASCSINITVSDLTPPTISCPANIVQNNTPGLCLRVVHYATPTASDNCSNATVRITNGPQSGAPLSPGYTTMIEYEATDGSGNTATCSFSVTIIDAEAPTITCPNAITQDNDLGACEAIISYPAPTAMDNCSGETVSLKSGMASGSAFPVGTTTVTYEVIDGGGNTALCSFDVTVNDTLAPGITCPANIIQANDQGACEATVTYASPSTSDACGHETLSRTAGPASGSAFPTNEVTTISYEVTDAAGNTADCSFTVTVVDTMAPTIVCPANIVQANDQGVCEAVVNYDTPTTYDNCGNEVLVMVSGKASGATCDVGSTETVVYEVTDQAGNTASCSFTITVNDSTRPVITCPSNISVDNRLDQCNALVTYSDPNTSDNCPGETYARIGGLASGSAFPANETSTVTFEATDAAGNTSICSFTVTVTDTTPPSITCPANISVSNDVGICGAEVTYAMSGGDNCTFSINQTDLTGLTSGDTYPIGITPQSYEASDAAGNTTACSFTVTVTDDEPINISCPGTLVRDTDAGSCDHTAVGNDLDLDGLVDNCAVASATNDLTSTSTLAGYVFSKGRTTVTWTMMDMYGNTSTCMHDVRIRDREEPVFDNCPDDSTIIVPAQTTGSYHTWTALTAVDNCNNANNITIDGFPLSGSYFSIGTTTVTWTAEDKAGNVGTCEFDVTVEEENAGVPSGWTFENIGTGATGTTTFDPQTGTLIIQSSGGTIGNTTDNVVGACLESSDATIDFRARVIPPGTGYYDQAGLMMRQTTTPNAATFSMLLSGTKVPTMMYRATTGSFPLATNGTTVSSPYWLRLYKSGATVTGYVSPDGITWTMIYAYPSTLSGTIELCLVSVTSGSQGNATFDNISVNGVAPRVGEMVSAGAALTHIDARAFPNPFENYLSVEGNVPVGTEEVIIRVINQMGQIIHQSVQTVDWTGTFDTQLTLDGLSAGMYIVEVTDGKERQQLKLVKR